MTPDKFCGLFGFLCSFFRRFCRVFGCFCGLPGTFPRPGSGILFFNGLFLLPPGEGIACKLGILCQALMVQCLDIRLFQPLFGPGSGPVGFQLVGMVCAFCYASACFRSFFYLMGAFHAYIVPLGLPDFFMYLARDGQPRNRRSSMTQTGRRGFLFYFFKMQAHRLFPGCRVDGAPLYLFLFLRDFLPCRLRFICRFLCMADMLL